MNSKKATRFAVVINVLQIAAVIGVFLYVLLVEDAFLSRNTELVLLGICLLIVGWGGIMDIREAMLSTRIAEQSKMLEEANIQLEDLNTTLRCQRHDFMNHLQVVFSLTEMQEYAESMQYIERVYGDIQRVGSFLKTSLPAVNALLAAKHAACTEDHIRFETDITSSWADLPVPGWEMCRILGNLIDNASDAIQESSVAADSFIRVCLGETPAAFTFSVSNNGPQIPDRHLGSIFQLGFTTKSDGHGSGLSIVTELVEASGGQLHVSSTSELTCFSGTIPKPASSLPVKQEERFT